MAAINASTSMLNHKIIITLLTPVYAVFMSYAAETSERFNSAWCKLYHCTGLLAIDDAYHNIIYMKA